MNKILNYFKNVSLLYGHLMVGLWTGNWIPYNQYITYTLNVGLVDLN